MARCPFCFRGFTLVELIVSISIMIIVMTITLSGRPEAVVRLALNDIASQTELLIRQVQLRGSAISSARDVYGGAGVFFDRASSTQIATFRDKVDAELVTALSTGNGLFDQGVSPEPKELLLYTRGNRIGKLCVSMSTSTFSCNDENDPVITNLTISFNRPSQKAHIYINNATTTDFSSACIQIDSVKSPEPGYVKSIYVYKSGMIIRSSDPCN